MTAKEMKRLSRADLLEMLIDKTKEYNELEKRLQAAEAALQERTIVLEEAGSIAEAALSMNGVFEAAQASCEQYMENIRARSDQQDEICRQREEESIAQAEQIIEDAKARSDEQDELCRQREQASIAQAEQIIEDAKARCAAMETATAQQCAAMVMEAKAKAEDYWAAVERKLEARYAEKAGYSELLTLALVQKEREGNHEARRRRRQKTGWIWPPRNR